jgi:hypothetical protein
VHVYREGCTVGVFFFGRGVANGTTSASIDNSSSFLKILEHFQGLSLFVCVCCPFGLILILSTASVGRLCHSHQPPRCRTDNRAKTWRPPTSPWLPPSPCPRNQLAVKRLRKSSLGQTEKTETHFPKSLYSHFRVSSVCRICVARPT